jgi:hypothetical protein
VGRILDPESWRIAVLVHGQAPEAGADCELEGDGATDRATCRVVESRAADGGVEVTVTASAGAAPWFENARSPHVRLTGGGGLASAPKERP